MKAAAAISAMAMAMLVLAMGAATARERQGWFDNFTPRDPAVKQPGRVEWTWDGADSLSLEAPVALHYTPGGSARVVVTGPQDMLAHMQFGQGRIRVDRDWHYSGRDRVQVTVSGVTVHNIALSGSGQATLEKLDLDRLNLAISGSGSLKGDGRSERINLVVSGSGNADLAALSVRAANIHISGSGNVRLSPRDEANVVTSGSGTVRMAARPGRLTQSMSGSGGARFDNNN